MQEEFIRLRDLYRQAEDKIKKIEREEQRLALPCVNELRYVGYHLLNALAETDQSAQKTEMNKSERHCYRAIYDATEIRLLSAMNQIKIFQFDYRTVCISDIIQNYAEICKDINQINASLGEINRENRDKHCETVETYSEKLEEYKELFASSRDELNKKMTKERKDELLKTAMLIAAVLAVVATGIAILV